MASQRSYGLFDDWTFAEPALERSEGCLRRHVVRSYCRVVRARVICGRDSSGPACCHGRRRRGRFWLVSRHLRGTLGGGMPGVRGNNSAAYVFVRSSGTWIQQAKLTASDEGSATWRKQVRSKE